MKYSTDDLDLLIDLLLLALLERNPDRLSHVGRVRAEEFKREIIRQNEDAVWKRRHG